VVVINNGKLVADGTMDQLQHQFEGTPVIHLEVHGDTADQPDPFTKIQGVEEVKRLQDPEPNVVLYRLIVKTGSDPRSEIFRVCVQNGLTLLGMSRETKSLENIFQQLTSTEAAVAATPAGEVEA